MCQPPGMSIAYIKEYIQPFPIICQGDYFDPMALPPEKFWCFILLCLTNSWHPHCQARAVHSEIVVGQPWLSSIMPHHIPLCAQELRGHHHHRRRQQRRSHHFAGGCTRHEARRQARG